MRIILNPNIKLEFKHTLALCFLSIATFISSCEDFVEIEPPINELVTKSVFEDDAIATAALYGIYGQMSLNFGSGTLFRNGSYLLSLVSDDQDFIFSGFQEHVQLYNNEIVATNSLILSIWSDLYQFIYKANSIIEGLGSSSTISAAVKNQLIGEAKFIRAMSHFYLVNLFGDVPLATTTNYQVNATMPRNPEAQVYEQIISDLNDAQKLLALNYVDATNTSTIEKIRPNKHTATALLARAYLYAEDWENAEVAATTVIDDGNYSLASDLNTVFLANSSEAILQLTPFFSNTLEGSWFSNTVFSKLTDDLYNAFEPDDNRKTNWIASKATGTLFPFKYKLKHSQTPARKEYTMVLRLAEQYLIRAEARAQKGDFVGAQEDLNVIRNRAGLSNTVAAEKTSLLLAIKRERRVEFFSEMGHRWLDLKRMGDIDDVMGSLKPTWQATDSLFPIPQIQVSNNPYTIQNPGY